MIQLFPPSDFEKNSVHEEIRPFAFGGLYYIVKVHRSLSAQSLAGGYRKPDFSYEDGAITLRITPVPYGVRLHLENHLDQAITLLGNRCSLLDVYGKAHEAELRNPHPPYPTRQPRSQELTIPPSTRSEIDLDIIVPAHREDIDRWARSYQERGAFITKDAPLPVFSSGFFVVPSALPDIQRLWTWAMDKEFGVYLEFNSNNNRYEYRFRITPYRLATGPVHQPEWADPQPSPSPLDRTD